MTTADATLTPAANAAPAPVARLAVLCDYAEEGWPSMDLCADMLLDGLRAGHGDQFQVTAIRPAFRRRAARLPLLGRRGFAHNADRLLNRHWDYPRHLRRRATEFDLFHVCDHSYAQLVHALPPGRAGVFCHDLDTFRCLLDPGAEPRPRWFRAMMGRVLRGLRRAAVVFHTTAEVRRQILAHGLVDPDRLVHAPLGVAAEFNPTDAGDLPAALLQRLDGAPFVLHVGSCIPRKRMDVLLNVFAAVRRDVPRLRLVKVGGPWSADQRVLLDRLGIAAAVIQFQGLCRSTIAALYRQAALVLLPSEAEGFGLPLLEALACGAAVLASDLAVLREVGGAAAVYRPVGDLRAWADAVTQILRDQRAAPPREVRLAQAQRFSWRQHAAAVAGAYQSLLDRGPGRAAP